MVEALLMHQLALSTGRTCRTLKMSIQRSENASVIYFPPLDEIIGRRYFANTADKKFDAELIECVSKIERLPRNPTFKLFEAINEGLTPEQQNRFTLCVHGPAGCLCLYWGNGYLGPGAVCIPHPEGKRDYIVEPWEHWIKSKLPVRDA